MALTSTAQTPMLPEILPANASIEGEMPLALSFRFTNNFHEWPSWNYPSYYEVYCVNYRIPGEKHPYIGAFFIAQYLIFLTICTPALVVIARPPLIEHTCYKLMLVLGLFENITSFMSDFMTGIFSIVGANYCDNNMLLIVYGHILHSTWYCYCALGVLLAFNRYIELRSVSLADRLFGGSRIYYWLVGPLLYGIILSTSIDLPPIYNTVYSVVLFQIDVSGKTPLVTNWVCFINSMWVMTALIIIYALLLRELRKKSKQASMGHSQDAKYTKMQMKVLLQCFLICVFLFIVLTLYALSSFVPMPLDIAIGAQISIQMTTICTSLVYLLFNSQVRNGVKEMICGSSSSRTTTTVHPIRTGAARSALEAPAL